MQSATVFLKAALLLTFLHGSYVHAFSQDISWMKGLWKEYSGTPYKVPPVKCVNTLQITAVADSAFTGIQTTFFAADTTVRTMYACSGLLTQNNKQFRRGDLVYKKNSNHAGYEWNDCANCDARTYSLYIEHDKLILHIATNNCDSVCNGTIAYYRNLNAFDSTIKQQLLSFYNSSQHDTSSSYSCYTFIYTNKISTATSSQNDENNATATDASLNISTLPVALRERTNKLAKTLQITSPYIEVILLDDAEIDGDIVSLYDNNEEVLSHKTLGREVIKYSIKADKQHAYHEIILVAENLGSIPPNTALMRIRAGDKKYELTTRANMHENAKVVIEYTGE